jgi:hypothetical protein
MFFTPNITFTSFIKIEGRVHEFNFRKKGADHFDGDTTDARGNRIFFQMAKGAETWTLRGENLPVWLMRHEGDVIALMAAQ